MQIQLFHLSVPAEQSKVEQVNLGADGSHGSNCVSFLLSVRSLGSRLSRSWGSATSILAVDTTVVGKS